MADMATQLDASELLILRAAWLETNHKPYEKESAMAKMMASDTAIRLLSKECRSWEEMDTARNTQWKGICGMQDHQIYEGTNEIMRLVVARNLLRSK